MKKYIYGGYFCFVAILGVILFPMANSSIEVKELKFEAIEEQMEGNYEVTAEEIMNELVRETEVKESEEPGISYEDAQLLMQIGVAEAEGDRVEGQAMVMAVIINRVNDPRFPNTIKEVIFQEGQFSSTTDGRYDRAVINSDSHEALAEIEMGNYDWVDALYFENCNSPSWQAKECTYLYTVGHHRFYKN